MQTSQGGSGPNPEFQSAVHGSGIRGSGVRIWMSSKIKFSGPGLLFPKVHLWYDFHEDANQEFLHEVANRQTDTQTGRQTPGKT